MSRRAENLAAPRLRVFARHAKIHALAAGVVVVVIVVVAHVVATSLGSAGTSLRHRVCRRGRFLSLFFLFVVAPLFLEKFVIHHLVLRVGGGVGVVVVVVIPFVPLLVLEVPARGQNVTRLLRALRGRRGVGHDRQHVRVRVPGAPRAERVQQDAARGAVFGEVGDALVPQLGDDRLRRELGVVGALQRARDKRRGVLVARDPSHLALQRLQHCLPLLGARVREHHVRGVRALARVDHAQVRRPGEGLRRLVLGSRTAHFQVLGQRRVHQRGGHEPFLQNRQKRGVHLPQHALPLRCGFQAHRLAQIPRRRRGVSSRVSRVGAAGAEKRELRAVKLAPHRQSLRGWRREVQALKYLRAHGVLGEGADFTLDVLKQRRNVLFRRLVDHLLHQKVPVQRLGELRDSGRALLVHGPLLRLRAVLEQRLDHAAALVVVRELGDLPLACLEHRVHQLRALLRRHLLPRRALLRTKPLPVPHHLRDQRVVWFRHRFLLRGPCLLLLLCRQRLLLPLSLLGLVVSFDKFLLLLPGARVAAAAAEPTLGFALLAQLPEALLGLRRRRGLGRVRNANGLHRVRPGAGPELRLATVAAFRRRAAARGFHRARHSEGARSGTEAGLRRRTEGPELGARVEARRFLNARPTEVREMVCVESGRAARPRAAAPRRQSTSGAVRFVSLVASAGSGPDFRRRAIRRCQFGSA